MLPNALYQATAARWKRTTNRILLLHFQLFWSIGAAFFLSPIAGRYVFIVSICCSDILGTALPMLLLVLLEPQVLLLMLLLVLLVLLLLLLSVVLVI
jgi:hypothetical protein